MIIYTLLEPWWRSQLGRSLILLAGLAMVTPMLFILALFFGLSRVSSETLSWIEAGVLFITCAAMVRRSYIWVKIAQEGAAMNGFPWGVATHRKAIAAGGLAAIAAYAAASSAGGTVQASLVAAVIAAAGGGVGVNYTRNKPAKKPPA
jgi:hypothetical protein